MNDQLQEFARQSLIESVPKLPAGYQRIFRLLYARDGGKRSVEEATALPINDVVAEMAPEKLDWAMKQVQNSFLKLEKQQQKPTP